MKRKIPRIGVAVLIFKNGKILLIKRKGSHGKNTWAPPGGLVEFWEKILQTAKREVKEETNLEIKNLKVLGFTEDFFKKEKRHFLTCWVRADFRRGKLKERDREFSKIGWFDLKKLPKPLFLCFRNFLEKKGYFLL